MILKEKWLLASLFHCHECASLVVSTDLVLVKQCQIPQPNMERKRPFVQSFKDN